MRIGIVGLGYVGLTLAIAAAARGAEVFGTEINPQIKASLTENRACFFEPKLNELIAKHNHKKLDQTKFRGDKRGGYLKKFRRTSSKQKVWKRRSSRNFIAILTARLAVSD